MSDQSSNHPNRNQGGKRRNNNQRKRNGGNRRGRDRRDQGGRNRPEFEPFPGYLSSPYSFVPVADEVFVPDTWGAPSHDLPFPDAVSGELRLVLTTNAPLYVRGADPKPERIHFRDWENRNPQLESAYGKWTEFYRDPETNRYAIPGTSVKGVIRNLLKIISFGSIGYVDDDFVSVRDLTDEKYRGEITRWNDEAMANEAKIRGGWLTENPDSGTGSTDWVITPCKVARVEQCQRYPSDPDGLEERFDLGSMALGKAMRPASQKYDIWDEKVKTREIQFNLPETSFPDGNDRHKHSTVDLYYPKAQDLGSPTAQLVGTIVFTGQSGPRERISRQTGARTWNNGSKHLEFIFHSEEPHSIPVSREAQKKFNDTHPVGKDGNKGWLYWKKVLERKGGKVPVFWIENQVTSQDASEERIDSFGLAQMFRLPARSLHDAIPPRHTRSEGLDLADRIFGRVKKDDSLRGRASFSGFELDPSQTNEQQRFNEVVTTVLGTPRPTFYPSYLEQPDYSLPKGTLKNGEYHTWLSPEVRIRGWKRYPVADSESIRHRHPIPLRRNGQKNWDVATAFRPLKAKTRFLGSMRFHNLTRRELGSLAWALTWGGDENFRHSLGMGKNLGMGSCTIEIDWEHSRLEWWGKPDSEFATELVEVDAGEVESSARRESFVQKCCDDFVVEMDAFTRKTLLPESRQSGWLESEPMRELLALADHRNANAWNDHKSFPDLMSRHFRDIKNRNLALPRPTEIVNRQTIDGRQTGSGNPPRLSASDR